jgi:FKBP-type peptidyl-prolyl cis-trans isomerase FkpA
VKHIVTLTMLAASQVLASGPAAPMATRGASAEQPKPLTAEESHQALYATGYLVLQRSPLGQISLTKEEYQVVIQGFTDAALGKPRDLEPSEVMPKVERLFAEQREVRATQERERSAPFLESAAAELGAQTLPSGLIYTELELGTGASPKSSDSVKVEYEGHLADGKRFDSSASRGGPATLFLGEIIPCLAEGIGRMKVGGKSRLVCPPAIAYGDRGAGRVPPGAALVFDIKLLAIPTQAQAGK